MNQANKPTPGLCIHNKGRKHSRLANEAQPKNDTVVQLITNANQNKPKGIKKIDTERSDNRHANVPRPYVSRNHVITKPSKERCVQANVHIRNSRASQQKKTKRVTASVPTRP